MTAVSPVKPLMVGLFSVALFKTTAPVLALIGKDARTTFVPSQYISWVKPLASVTPVPAEVFTKILWPPVVALRTA